MSYYFGKTVSAPFSDIVERAKVALKSQGFGVLMEINVQEVLKQKIGADFRPYRILGACNPGLAHRALSSEDKIGTMLPCNVIVQDLGGGRVEVAAIDPLAAMGRIDNPALEKIAAEVAEKLSLAVASV